MIAQFNQQGAPGGPEGRKLKLLLVDRDYELKDDVASRIFGGDRLWMVVTSRASSAHWIACGLKRSTLSC